MLDVGLSEFFVIGAVALLVVGPKELPALMARVGRWTGKARAMARHARSGWDAMVREAEIEEMNKRWEAENARIMAATQGQSFADPAPAGQTVVDPARDRTDVSASPAGTAEVAPADTFLPGFDGWGAEDRTERAGHGRAADARAGAGGVTLPPDGVGTVGAGGPDLTDWRDPPGVMRPPPPVPPAAVPPAAPAALTSPAPAPAPAPLPGVALPAGPAAPAVASIAEGPLDVPASAHTPATAPARRGRKRAPPAAAQG